jgi:uncharacterized protein YaaW (UPF0174 family)
MALELATETELSQLTQILFTRKFNPLDYVSTPDPMDIQSLDRSSLISTLEARFRYLAADGLTVLQGTTQTVTYRQTLIRICKYLKIPYAQTDQTTDIETGVFLYLMGKSWDKLPASEQKALNVRVQKSFSLAKLERPLPSYLQKDPVKIILKGSSAIALTSVLQPWMLQQIARQFAIHFATYQVAKESLIRGGIATQSYVAMFMAKRGMTLSAAKYGAVRGIFSILGPVMWGWFLADLGWRSISTNYGRIIPTVVALAQIRLLRSHCWEMA